MDFGLLSKEIITSRREILSPLMKGPTWWFRGFYSSMFVAHCVWYWFTIKTISKLGCLMLENIVHSLTYNRK